MFQGGVESLFGSRGLGSLVLGGVVLAAGASTRFGSPKALVPIQGEPAVARIVRLLRANGCDPVAVVVGADRERIQGAVPPSAELVVNHAWAKGRTGSIKAGARALPLSCSPIVWPVDHPAVAGATIRALVEGPGDIRVPVYDHRRGHPILLEARLREEILALGDDQPFHDLVHREPRRVVDVPVDDAGIHLNIDVPEDAKKLDAHFGRPPRARAPT